VLWATREARAALLQDLPGDPLPLRLALFAEARALAAGANPVVKHLERVALESLEFNSATHRYRATFARDDQPMLEEVDQIVVNTGFGPDNSLYRELQVHECYGSRGPMNLSAVLLGAGADCTKVPAVGADVLKNPEPEFFILGGKSYARYNTFLLETGYHQVADVVPTLAKGLLATAAL
jgi:hypothetical protein